MKLKPFSFIKSVSPPFGLDISDLSLKLVSLDSSSPLSLTSKKRNVKILAHNQINIPPGYFQEGTVLKTDQVISLIKKIVKETSSPKKLSNYVVSVLPETKAFVKLIEIPNVNKENIVSEIEKEIKNHFPFTLDEIYLDWQKIESNKDQSKTKILVSVSPKEIVEQYTNILLAAGLKPYVLEIESSAICRALLKEEFTSKKQKDEKKSSLAIIDIGATRTSLIFYDNGTIQFTTSVPFSGERITEKIAAKLKIDRKEAEKAKIECGLDDKKCQGVLKKVLLEDVKEMITKIENSFSFYAKTFDQNQPIEKIITCGGGANFKGLNSIIQNELGIKTEIGNPLINICSSEKNILKNNFSDYTTATGLALRGILNE